LRRQITVPCSLLCGAQFASYNPRLAWGDAVDERILVVDDQCDVADALAKLITALGYEAKAVYDGQHALDEVARSRPDMALIDLGMPGLDGYEIATRIRELRGGLPMILVAVTGWTRREDKQRAYECGFDLHVSKPMTIETLEELLNIIDPSRCALMAHGSQAGHVDRLSGRLSKGA